MPADNPYSPPAAQGVFDQPPSGTSHRSTFYRGAYLVFRLLALFSLVGVAEEALRLPSCYLLSSSGSTALTAAMSIVALLGLAARLLLLLWTLGLPPDRSPRGWGAPIGWAVALAVSGLATSGLSAASTMVLMRVMDTAEAGAHILAVNVISTVKWTIHGGLMVLGLLTAFKRWRAVGSL